MNLRHYVIIGSISEEIRHLVPHYTGSSWLKFLFSLLENFIFTDNTGVEKVSVTAEKLHKHISIKFKLD